MKTCIQFYTGFPPTAQSLYFYTRYVCAESFLGPLVAAGQHASKLQQQDCPVMFSIVSARDAAFSDVKRALVRNLEDLVYKTSLSFTHDLDAHHLQTLLQMQSAGVKISVGQLSYLAHQASRKPNVGYVFCSCF